MRCLGAVLLICALTTGCEDDPNQLVGVTSPPRPDSSTVVEEMDSGPEPVEADDGGESED